RVPNVAGLKVSDSPFEKIVPYLIEDLDVFVGAESLIHLAMAAGAAGAVSGLAAAFLELTAAAVRDGTAEASARAPCGRTSSGSRGTRRSSASCSTAACRCARTSGHRYAS